MFKDEFRMRYTTIPFATFHRNHSKEPLPQDKTTLAHKHKEIEIVTILKGNARFYVDTRTYEVREGDIIIISPYLLHNATLYANSTLEHYCLCFDPELLPDHEMYCDLEKGRKRASHLVRDKNLSPVLSHHIESAFRIHAVQKKGWELQVIGHMSILLGLLKENGLIYETATRNSDPISYRIIDYIENNYSKNISSADVAKSLYISKSYFCRIFKENFGYCFHEYLCMYRIERAKILLTTTSTNVADIALAVGFNSFSYFSQMFKVYLQVTPSEYRKKGQ